ncbi:MAG: CRISPR-associated endonuclease Cas1 [Lachnospiraceae bacterium]|nr:CRISPR-associated endonuclease Cas1 [Lachnospiraceae bacterium]
MAVLYIKEQGSMIVKRSERIVVTKGREELLEMPVANIDNIAIIGNVQISTQALHMLMEKGIDVSYFSLNGKYLGHAFSDSSKNVFLRFSQYKIYQDIEKRLLMAKIIVNNKIQNQINVIYNHRWSNGYDYKRDIQQMKKLQFSLSEKKTPNEILGIEGKCSNIYFGAYGQMFVSKIKFNGRNRRPPRDPVNVILSLGYTFLTKDICSVLEAESFEMYLGFLHGIRYGRKSLALDIVEEFRQPIIDRLVVYSFNKGIFSYEDFEENNDLPMLNEEGFAKFCQTYEKWLRNNKYSKQTYSYREIIKKQAKILKKAIQNDTEYVPYVWEK